MENSDSCQSITWMNMKLNRAKQRAWDAFSKYIRLRDAIKTTGTTDKARCFTCRKVYPAFGRGCLQAGHFIPGRQGAVLIDEIGVNAQCYNCNHKLKGAWLEYENRLIYEQGRKVVEQLKHKKYLVFKRNAAEWLDIEKQYKSKYEQLLNEHR